MESTLFTCMDFTDKWVSTIDRKGRSNDELGGRGGSVQRKCKQRIRKIGDAEAEGVRRSDFPALARRAHLLQVRNQSLRFPSFVFIGLHSFHKCTQNLPIFFRIIRAGSRFFFFCHSQCDRTRIITMHVMLIIRVNGIDFEEVRIDLAQGQHRSPQFQGDPFAHISRLSLFQAFF